MSTPERHLRHVVNIKGGSGAEYSGAFRSAVRFQPGYLPTLVETYDEDIVDIDSDEYNRYADPNQAI
jgi:hypothetical protein